MRLYGIFVVLVCTFKTGYFAETSQNNLEDDHYYPILKWSDTFDWKLLKAVASNQSGNVLISPIGLKLALITLFEGSAGATEKEFQSVLQFSASRSELRAQYKKIFKSLQTETEKYILHLGSRIFLQHSISPRQVFQAIIKDAYDTDVDLIDFNASVNASYIINPWAETLSNGHIDHLVEPDDFKKDDFVMLLTNAIYFKGLWRESFSKHSTHDGIFSVSSENSVTVSVIVSYMFNVGNYYFGELRELDAKILRVPYQGGQFAMFFILPNKIDGLQKLLAKINLVTIKHVLLYLMDKQMVNVVIPKFKFEFGISYRNILQDMGLASLFSDTASLPGISRGFKATPTLLLNDIKQKTSIKIDEEGSEVVTTENKSAASNANFNATHPFVIFMDHSETGTIALLGTVVNP